MTSWIPKGRAVLTRPGLGRNQWPTRPVVRVANNVVDVCWSPEKRKAKICRTAWGYKVAAAGLELFYLSTDADVRYEQGGAPFVPDLSVIDVLMFNSLAQTHELLDRFELLPPQSSGG